MKRSAKRPFSGLRILVGRARHQASQLSHGLRQLGADVIEIPFIEIRKPRSYKPLDAALKQIENYEWLILTSVNGVDALADRMKKLRMNHSVLRNLQIAAIGPATRNRIELLGLKVTVVPKRYIAESMVESLRSKVKGKRVLLVRAKVARDVIPRELREMGAKVDVVEAYETVVPPASRRLLRQVINDPKRRPHVVAFTSSSTVRNFVQLLSPVGSLYEGKSATHFGETNANRSSGTTANSPALQRRGSPSDEPSPAGTTDVPKGIKFASIGPVTSATLSELGLQVHLEATEYTISGLITAIARYNPSARAQSQ